MKKLNPVGTILNYNFNDENYQNTEHKIIIGIDPGLKNLGIGIILVNRYHQILNYSGLLFKIKQNRTIEEKLHFIYEEIEKLIRLIKPDLIIVEDAFVGLNKGSAIKLGYTRGAIFALIGKYKVPLQYLSPKLIKMQVSGKGDCTKEFLQEKLNKIFVDFNIESLDVTDALACAISGLDYLKQ